MSVLKVENMYKKFGRTEVLKGVDFSLNEGEVLSIIGSSGSGKTTLLRCLNFLETADKGQIFLNDELIFDAELLKEYSDKDIREKRLNFGLVFQQFNLFPQYTALRNVTLALELLNKAKTKKGEEGLTKEQIEQKAVDMLDKVGLADKVNNYPCELSGGQQQRVAIARALVLDPKILFFDEPTSALDPELTGEILKVINNLAKQKRTMVIVTHEMKFAAEISDKVIFMDDGVIAEQGTPEQVIKNPKNPRVKQFINALNN